MTDLLEDYRKLVKDYLSSEYNSVEHIRFNNEEPILFKKIMNKNIDKKILYDIVKEVANEVYGEKCCHFLKILIFYILC